MVYMSRKSGFTLIEVLLVIAIIVTLAAVVFVSLNPAQRLKDSRDARRTNDVNTILTAIQQYIIDNKGALPTGLTAGMSETQIGTGASGCAISTGGCTVAATACVNLTTPLTNYLASLPIDPTGSTTYTAAKTGYSVVVSSAGIVTVRACGTEGTTNILVSR